MPKGNLDLIFKRRSVRSYTDQPVADDIIEQLLSAISFGYPTSIPGPRKRFFPEHVHYDKW